MALHTAHSELDDLGAGHYRQTLSLKPIAYRRNGSLVRIQNALGNTGDATLPIGVDELAQFRVRDKLAGQSPMLFFGKGNSHVRITPLNTNNVNGVVSGQSITFPEAWNNADLRLTIAGHRLQKDVLLKSGHPASFAFRIDDQAGLDIPTLSTPDFRILQPVLLSPAGLRVPLSWVVSTQGGKTVLTVTLPAGDYAGWVLDPTLTLQPDATDGIDAEMQSVNTALNYGVGVNMASGLLTGAYIFRAVLKVDISSVPASATITAADLTLYNTDSSYTTANNTVEVFALLAANADWVEGTKDGATAANGEVCWAQREYNVANWAGSAGCGTSATDYAASAIGSLAVTDAVAEALTTALTVATVQDWLAGNNYGMLLRGTNEATVGRVAVFAASDNATAANRPKLVIEYSLPSAAQTFTRAPMWGRF